METIFAFSIIRHDLKSYATEETEYLQVINRRKPTSLECSKQKVKNKNLILVLANLKSWNYSIKNTKVLKMFEISLFDLNNSNGNTATPLHTQHF